MYDFNKINTNHNITIWSYIQRVQSSLESEEEERFCDDNRDQKIGVDDENNNIYVIWEEFWKRLIAVSLHHVHS